MVKVRIAEQSKTLSEITPAWITKTINKNRIMDIENEVEVDIDSQNAKLKLCTAGDKVKPTNEIESRITFLWDDIVLSEHDLDPNALYDFLKRMDEWVSFIPKR